MKAVVVVPVVAAVAWVLAPIVDMAVRGTIDSRTVAAWRTEGRPPVADVPGPRVSPESGRTSSGHRAARRTPA